MRIRKYKIRNEEHEVADLRILKAQLNQQLFMISQPNEKVMDAAWQRWDSVARGKHIPLSVISEGMGHDSEKTTLIYLAALDTTVIDKANMVVLREFL